MSDSKSQARPIRVLLVDDHAMVRQGLRHVLEVHPDVEVVGEASDGEEAVKCILQAQPTVAVIDIIMPKMDGIEATRAIKKQYPQIAVVGLTREPKDYIMYSMTRAGASEVVDKNNAVVELYNAIRKSLASVGGLSSMAETI
jgi:two-component system, NarL family, response regulator LiaR